MKLDLLVAIAFVVVQWRITTLWLRRYPGRTGLLLAVAGNLVLAVGYACSFSEVVSYYHLSPRIAVVFGASALAYLILATGVLSLHFLVHHTKRIVLSPELDPSRRRILDLAGLALVTSPLAVMGYGALFERTNFRVREVDVRIPGLHPDLEGLRILQLSDIHLSAFLSERQFSSVVDEANQLRPHLAVITGDLISSRGDPLDACLRQVARLRADAGAFGCMGNHERYAGAEQYTTAASARLGVPFLRQKNRLLRFGGGTLNLAGVDYQRMLGDRSLYLPGAEQWRVPGAFNVLLSHNPDVFPQAARLGYDLTLSGHTHGGQVSIEILDQSINPARFFTPFVSGLYHQDGAAAYVTRGIGTIGIPARIGAPPEITLLRLRKA